MRFSNQKKLREAYFSRSVKVKEKFLWFPLTIDGETRWLENAKIEYRVKYDIEFFSDVKTYYWVPFQFLNN